MSITFEELLDKMRSIIQPALEPRHYILSSPPLSRKTMIWFEKEPRSDDQLYRIVEFQPSGFSQNEIIKVAINLQRRSYRDYDNPSPGSIQKGDLFVRLSPRLWTEKSQVMDYWWDLYPPEELTDKFNDMLTKLIDYGVPFLEDRSSTQVSWLRG